MMPRDCVCESCGLHFESAWTDEEALAESRALWREEDMAKEGGVLLCDPCFERFFAWARSRGLTKDATENDR